MTEAVRKRGAVNYISAFIAGLFIAAVIATLFTALILAVTDFFLFTRPPSVGFGVWAGRIFERMHWTFVLILWGLTFFAALISLFGDFIKRSIRKKLDGEK